MGIEGTDELRTFLALMGTGDDQYPVVLNGVDEIMFYDSMNIISLARAEDMVERSITDWWEHFYTFRRSSERALKYLERFSPPVHEEPAWQAQHTRHVRAVEYAASMMEEYEKLGRELLHAAILERDLKLYWIDKGKIALRCEETGEQSRDVTLMPLVGAWYNVVNYTKVDGRFVEVVLLAREFDEWLATARAMVERTTEGITPQEDKKRKRPRWTPTADVAIRLLKEKFPATGGDPGEDHTIADLAREFRARMDTELPDYKRHGSDAHKAYEERVRTAVKRIRAGHG